MQRGKVARWGDVSRYDCAVVFHRKQAAFTYFSLDSRGFLLLYFKNSLQWTPFKVVSWGDLGGNGRNFKQMDIFFSGTFSPQGRFFYKRVFFAFLEMTSWTEFTVLAFGLFLMKNNRWQQEKWKYSKKLTSSFVWQYFLVFLSFCSLIFHSKSPLFLSTFLLLPHLTIKRHQNTSSSILQKIICSRNFPKTLMQFLPKPFANPLLENWSR